VNQDVAPRERLPEPLPPLVASDLDEIDACVFVEELRRVVEALEDVALPAD
jgi:hypothetical protein